MSGIGQLVVTQGDIQVAGWLIREGGGVSATLNGSPFRFTLDKAPLPSGYDIRELSTVAIAEYLAQRVKDEAALADDLAERDYYEA